MTLPPGLKFTAAQDSRPATRLRPPAAVPAVGHLLEAQRHLMEVETPQDGTRTLRAVIHCKARHDAVLQEPAVADHG